MDQRYWEGFREGALTNLKAARVIFWRGCFVASLCWAVIVIVGFSLMNGAARRVIESSLKENRACLDQLRSETESLAKITKPARVK